MKNSLFSAILSIGTVAVILPAAVIAEEKPAVRVAMSDHIFRPAVVKPTPERVESLTVPKGFKISVFAQNLKSPRVLAVGARGDVYVSRRAPFNDVLLLRKGATDQPVTVAKIPGVHGLAINDSKMYLAAVRKVYVAELKSDGTLETPKEIYTDLPDAGQHPNRTLAFSPKGELFLSVGSTCNEAPEPNPESATMLVIQPDGSGRKIFASGLRNTIGFDWNPKTGQLWGMDHGIDWLGDEEQREELNQLVENQKYGWPFIYEDGKPNLNRDPETTEGVTWTEYAKTCVSPVLTMDAHSAPMQFLFCKGTQFPEEYRGDAFLTLHGSWNRKEPTGYKVVRVRFKDGRPQSYEDFLSGFLTRDNQAQFGRPCGLAFLPDGTLLVGDDQNGVIYQVAYVGAK